MPCFVRFSVLAFERRGAREFETDWLYFQWHFFLLKIPARSRGRLGSSSHDSPLRQLNVEIIQIKVEYFPITDISVAQRAVKPDFNVNTNFKTYHFVTHLTPLDSRSSGCRVEVCGFHCRSSQAFEVDAIEKSSEKSKKKNIC